LLLIASQFPSQFDLHKKGNEALISKFREDGMKASQLMDHTFYLSKASGPDQQHRLAS
jgi:hypothetical protein